MTFNLDLADVLLNEVVNLIKIEEAQAEAESNGFNPFKEFFKFGELKHSQVLGWLLRPYCSHGQGTLFLQAFLTRLGIANPEKRDWIIQLGASGVDIMLQRNNPNQLSSSKTNLMMLVIKIINYIATG